MRTITISTPVFAKIWALRRAGEETEDTILRRVLACEVELSSTSRQIPSNTDISIVHGGYFDRRSGVRFPEGFEIFRNYLGTNYRARANDGRWILENDNSTHGSLNELSRTIGAKSENTWLNWSFLDSDGNRMAITELRDQNKIQRRNRMKSDPTSEASQTKDLGATRQSLYLAEIPGDGTWRAYVWEGLRRLGGKARLHRIYNEVERMCVATERPRPKSFEAIIRRTLEENSTDSEVFRGNDLFRMAEGRGAGVWALKDKM